MLIEFRLKNFKSFKEWQTLSMVASSDRSLPDNVTRVEALGHNRLVQIAVVYGANASGKSNLVDALSFVHAFVANSAESKPGMVIEVAPFLLDESSSASPSEFEISFIHQGVRYQYGFSVDRQRVYDEWLIAYPKGKAQTWFERPVENFNNPTDWYFGPNLKGEKKKLLPLLRPEVLFLSLAPKFSNKQLTAVYDWFSDQLRGISIPEGLFNQLEQFTAKQVKESPAFHTWIRTLLKFADLGIMDIAVDKKQITEEDFPVRLFSKEARALFLKQEQLEIKLYHRTQEDHEQGIALSFESGESRGTRRVFALAGPWQDTLSSGYTLVVDELDASLHPALVRELIRLFHNAKTNQSGAQLIFNTHDTTLLDTELFRRDQIWFMEKDNAGVSVLYPLLEFSPRKSEALARGYLQGRYGAIPFIGSLAGFDSDGEA
ncbi:MAG: ATP-binding protein [Anaerolineae bacterium]|nr:ATP-binding protein [Anaerolineae bacterium]